MTSWHLRGIRKGVGKGLLVPGWERPTPPPRLREGDQARDLVTTVLTLSGPPLTRPTRILGMLRFFFGVRRRCRVDVSAVDTRVLAGFVIRSTVVSSITGLPRFLPE